TPLQNLINTHQPDLPKSDQYFMKEFILWALVEFKKLSKYRMTDGIRFKDLYGSYISGL
ncbi:MAG: magnesium chelatase, partial [Bacteroidota bacterium]|nr:magnesium chelatase [Bacteroidota bacterium]